MPQSHPRLLAGAAAAMVAVLPAQAAVLGPHAAACQGGRGPAMLVRVEGLKARTGLLRVQSYGGDPARFFAKRAYLERVEVPVPPAGQVEVCMPVPAPGAYAVSVRHDVAGDGKAGMADGGGVSGNPKVSLMDVVLKRRPSPAETAVEVRGVRVVPVVMNYVHGASVGPIAGTER